MSYPTFPLPLATLALCLFSALTFAQEDAPQEKPNTELVPMFARPVAGHDMSEAQRQGAEFAKRLVEQIPHHVNPDTVPGMPDWRGMQNRAQGITDAALMNERDAVMRFIGLPGDGHAQLYYFVSTSMPNELLRAYAREAMWTGGTLVFRGVPPGYTVGRFLRENLAPLVRNKGATAAVTIDPRVYDLYDIRVAPTIVYTEAEDPMRNPACLGRPVIDDTNEAGYNKCTQADPNKYWKVEGAVTTAWALDAMVKDGAEGAIPFREALSRGGMGKADKEMQPYASEEGEVTPQELKALNDALSGSGLQAYSFKDFSAVGPAGMNVDIQNMNILTSKGGNSATPEPK